VWVAGSNVNKLYQFSRGLVVGMMSKVCAFGWRATIDNEPPGKL
jgi:hypothetical protein